MRARLLAAAATAAAVVVIVALLLRPNRHDRGQLHNDIKVVRAPDISVTRSPTIARPAAPAAVDVLTPADRAIIQSARRAVELRLAPRRVVSFADEHLVDAKRSLVCGRVVIADGAKTRRLPFVSFPLAAITTIDDDTPAFHELEISLCGSDAVG